MTQQEYRAAQITTCLEIIPSWSIRLNCQPRIEAGSNNHGQEGESAGWRESLVY